MDNAVNLKICFKYVSRESVFLIYIVLSPSPTWYQLLCSLNWLVDCIDKIYFCLRLFDLNCELVFVLFFFSFYCFKVHVGFDWKKPNSAGPLFYNTGHCSSSNFGAQLRPKTLPTAFWSVGKYTIEQIVLLCGCWSKCVASLGPSDSSGE